MIAELLQVVKSKISTIKNYPGPSVLVNGKGLRSMEAESYGLAGIVNLPPEGTRVIYLPYGGTRRGACVGGHNYKITHDLDQGEIKIFSTNADGDTVKAEITLKADGKISVVSDSDISVQSDGKITANGTSIELNGNSKKFVTHAELNTALQAFIVALNLHVHGNAGTPPVTPMSLDISASSTTNVSTGG